MNLVKESNQKEPQVIYRSVVELSGIEKEVRSIQSYGKSINRIQPQFPSYQSDPNSLWVICWGE